MQDGSEIVTPKAVSFAQNLSSHGAISLPPPRETQSQVPSNHQSILLREKDLILTVCQLQCSSSHLFSKDIPITGAEWIYYCRIWPRTRHTDNMERRQEFPSCACAEREA
jgi:hypothetical protein